jgi:hypothetical protein
MMRNRLLIKPSTPLQLLVLLPQLVYFLHCVAIDGGLNIDRSSGVFAGAVHV